MRTIQAINDDLSDDARQRLNARIPLIPSLVPGYDPEVLIRVERRIALWAARSVEHLDAAGAKECNDRTERYLVLDLTGCPQFIPHVGEYVPGCVAFWAAAAAAEPRGAIGDGWVASSAVIQAAHAAAATLSLHLASGSKRDEILLAWLDDFLDAWRKIAADEGLMGDLDWLDPEACAYEAVGGS